MNLICGEVKAVANATDPAGEFEVVLSAPTLDRDGEVLEAGCFNPLPKHITFDIDHGLTTATTVGSGAPFYDGGVLKVKGTFSSIPRAQEVRTLITEGHIRTTSVTFMGAQRETKDGVPHVTRAELLNGAFVPVPSNRQALVLAAKAGLWNPDAGTDPPATSAASEVWSATADLAELEMWLLLDAPDGAPNKEI